MPTEEAKLAIPFRRSRGKTWSAEQESQLVLTDIIEMKWWRVGDLNPRPPRCERGALPAELTPHAQKG